MGDPHQRRHRRADADGGPHPAADTSCGALDRSVVRDGFDDERRIDLGVGIGQPPSDASLLVGRQRGGAARVGRQCIADASEGRCRGHQDLEFERGPLSSEFVVDPPVDEPRHVLVDQRGMPPQAIGDEDRRRGGRGCSRGEGGENPECVGPGPTHHEGQRLDDDAGGAAGGTGREQRCGRHPHVEHAVRPCRPARLGVGGGRPGPQRDGDDAQRGVDPPQVVCPHRGPASGM